MRELLNYKEIEEKWQKAWSEARVFESEITDKKSFLVTAAIPYVNSPPHIGHMRTFGTADTYARYLRMRGYNVLYPFGFHATGTPVVGFAKRIANRDQELIDELHLFHVTDYDIKKMTDPAYIAEYFIAQQEREFRRAGLGIDWRRKFISTEPMFSKMVEWQFGKLKEKGYLVQGTHPIGWCTNEQQAVGQHDTKHDVQPKIEELVAIKFKDTGGDAYFVCSTYRPETIYGVTNLFINDKVKYSLVRIDGVLYYMSTDAAKKLGFQMKIEVISDVFAEDLLKKKAVNPVTKEEVPVLPGFFVKGEIGTGVVMSVPSHAPFDYAALERLKASGYQMPKMEYKKLIEIEPMKGITIGRSLSDVTAGEVRPQHPEIPALAYLEILHTNPNAIDDMLEFATKLIYREESHWGVMLVGAYKGKREPEAREGLKKELWASKDALKIYEIVNPEPVVCRCGTKVIVNIVSDQWFINYGNEEWKKQVRAHLSTMKIYPEKYRKTFETVIDWIDLRAAERAQGLGTRFPLNPQHIIESLSDSTIYMLFYTFDNILRTAQVKPEQLLPQFFDFMFLDTLDAEGVARLTGIDITVVRRCKESLEYWYKDTSRHSGPDLIYNHYVMYLFNHVGLLPQKFWPKQIVVNGFVNYEGEKMSKSLGNIVPLGDGVEQHGSDPLRFIEIAGAELDTETEFSTEGISSVLARNQFLLESIDRLNTLKAGELSHMDYWLYSKLHSKIVNATRYMDNLEFRSAYTEIYYNSISELRTYFERGGRNQMVVREYLEAVTLMLAPIMPHTAEEFWHILSNTTMVVQERWPTGNESMINRKVELTEQIISQTIEDITQAITLTSKIDANKGKKPESIRIIVAEEWKRQAYDMLIETKDMSRVMKAPEFEKIDKERLAKFLGPFMGKLQTLQKMQELPADDLYAGFATAGEYLAKKFDSEIALEKEAGSQSPRAARAIPGKPSIDIIWG